MGCVYNRAWYRNLDNEVACTRFGLLGDKKTKSVVNTAPIGKFEVMARVFRLYRGRT